MEIRRAMVTGAAGFTGAVLVETLRKYGVIVYALVRPGSPHNARLAGDPGIRVIEVRSGDFDSIIEKIDGAPEVCFHLMWMGGTTEDGQEKNEEQTLAALRAAAKAGCKRFVATGSQAEYGVVLPDEIADEEREPAPISAYGVAKVKACQASRTLAKELGIEWIWARIFSLIGMYEPQGRMLPDLYRMLRNGQTKTLSSCRQNWDYLDVYDAAEALIALAQSGESGEIYNVAHGDYRPLKEYTEELRRLVSPETEIIYADDPNPFISLQPSVEKLKTQTGWRPLRSFEDSIRDYEFM